MVKLHFFGFPEIKALFYVIQMFGKLVHNHRIISQSRLFSTSLRDISIKGFFAAQNYAIVGASTKPGTMGNIICENYKRTFKGKVFYINPKGNSQLSYYNI